MGEASGVPADVTSIMEIIINGRDLETVADATYSAIDACIETSGLVKISAGTYGGRLGKSFIYLIPKAHLQRPRLGKHRPHMFVAGDPSPSRALELLHEVHEGIDATFRKGVVDRRPHPPH